MPIFKQIKYENKYAGHEPADRDTTYIVDIGGYIDSTTEISNMINAGLALSIVRQQLTYGDDLFGMPEPVRVRYMEKMDVLSKASEMSAHAVEARKALNRLREKTPSSPASAGEVKDQAPPPEGP